MMLIFSVFAVCVEGLAGAGVQGRCCEACWSRLWSMLSTALLSTALSTRRWWLLWRLGVPEEARAELVAGLWVPEEVKAELTARLGVSEESKSSISGSSGCCLKGDIVGCIGVLDFSVSSCSSGIMKGDVIDYIDVLDYSDYIVYVCRQEAFETGATIVGFILDGCVLSRRASSRLFLEEDLRSPQLFQVVVTVCH